MNLRWRLMWLRNKLIRQVCRRVYVDRFRDIARTMIIAGTGRSGTTWLASMVRRVVPCRVMFEPFHRRLVDDFCFFRYFHYQRPGETDELLERFVDKLLCGAIRHPWIDREVDILLPRYRLIKEIRGNLLLKWLTERFPEVPFAFVIRHPCAVVSSRMQLGWETDRDVAPFLRQGKLCDDFIGPFVEDIAGAENEIEKHAIVWCVSNLVPLKQFGDALPVFYYEDFCDDTTGQLAQLLRVLRRDEADAVGASGTTPSMTSKTTSAIVGGGDRVTHWKTQLTPSEIGTVLRVVERFGLDQLYGESPRPLRSRL